MQSHQNLFLKPVKLIQHIFNRQSPGDDPVYPFGQKTDRNGEIGCNQKPDGNLAGGFIARVIFFLKLMFVVTSGIVFTLTVIRDTGFG